MSTQHYHDELICLRDAAKRLPSHHAGKRVHMATLYRWIASGRLPAVRRGRWWFVRPEDLDALAVPYRHVTLPRAGRPSPAWVQDYLRKHRII